MISGFVILSLGMLASLWYACAEQKPDYNRPLMVKNSLFMFPFIFYFSSMIVRIILIYRSSWKVGLIVAFTLNLAVLGGSFIGRRLTPLNKNHLKNVMVFISKLFNGVNADHQNLCW